VVWVRTTALHHERPFAYHASGEDCCDDLSRFAFSSTNETTNVTLLATGRAPMASAAPWMREFEPVSRRSLIAAAVISARQQAIGSHRSSRPVSLAQWDRLAGLASCQHQRCIGCGKTCFLCLGLWFLFADSPFLVTASFPTTRTTSFRGLSSAPTPVDMQSNVARKTVKGLIAAKDFFVGQVGRAGAAVSNGSRSASAVPRDQGCPSRKDLPFYFCSSKLAHSSDNWLRGSVSAVK
jgi:hypothetical protein